MAFYSSIEFWLLSAIAVLLGLCFSTRREFVYLLLNFLFLYFALNFSAGACVGYLVLAIAVWSLARVLVRYPDIGLQALGVIALIAILGVSKYTLFAGLTPYSGVALLGISYFTFKAIHYLVDAAAGRIEDLSLSRYLNFMFFFPALVSGPMDRYQRFAEDARDVQRPSKEEAMEGLFRIAIGAFKKFVLASLVLKYTYHLKAPAEIASLTTEQMIKGAYAYTFLLYFDFSGYSDMAIGLSRWLGIKLPENFNSPFLSLSIQEFWTRWHITLSQWIRDYIFNPLSRALYLRMPSAPLVGPSALAIFTAFLLCGVWHGDGWNFLLWGGIHGLALSVHMVYREYMKKRHRQLYKKIKDRRAYKIMSWAITFHFVVLSLVIFSMDLERLGALLWRG